MEGLVLVLVVGPVLVLGDPVLRFRTQACNTLEPQYVSESWQQPGAAPGDTEGEDLFDSEVNQNQKSRERNPPWSLVAEFREYRRGREYSVSVVAEEYFEAFVLQARAEDRPDGNATLVGEWVDLPPGAAHLRCLGQSRATVTDKGLPVLLGNLTFTWRAPTVDYGPIRFVLSLVRGEKYTELSTESITFNAFPVSVHGCGRQMSCFRRCSTNPTCPAAQADFMVVMYLSRNKEELVISMGGLVEERTDEVDSTKGNKTSDEMPELPMEKPEGYVAVGFGRDRRDRRHMDVAACYKDGKDVRLGHYYVEDKDSVPGLHRAQLSLDGTDLDVTESGTFIWCQFRRPVLPDTIWELDLSVMMFQFFFTGSYNRSMIEVPDTEAIWTSRTRRNFSEITNDISFRAVPSWRSGRSGAGSPRPFVLSTGLATVLSTGLAGFAI